MQVFSYFSYLGEFLWISDISPSSISLQSGYPGGFPLLKCLTKTSTVYTDQLLMSVVSPIEHSRCPNFQNYCACFHFLRPLDCHLPKKNNLENAQPWNHRGKHLSFLLIMFVIRYLWAIIPKNPYREHRIYHGYTFRATPTCHLIHPCEPDIFWVFDPSSKGETIPQRREPPRWKWQNCHVTTRDNEGSSSCDWIS